MTHIYSLMMHMEIYRNKIFTLIVSKSSSFLGANWLLRYVRKKNEFALSSLYISSYETSSSQRLRRRRRWRRSAASSAEIRLFAGCHDFVINYVKPVGNSKREHARYDFQTLGLANCDDPEEGIFKDDFTFSETILE